MNWLLSPLITIANFIVCMVMGFFYLVADGIIYACNLAILALATVVSVVAALMPTMPGLPSMPTAYTTSAGWVAWFWPVGTTVAILGFVVTAWLLWIGVSTVLRWAKVIGV